MLGQGGIAAIGLAGILDSPIVTVVKTTCDESLIWRRPSSLGFATETAVPIAAVAYTVAWAVPEWPSLNRRSLALGDTNQPSPGQPNPQPTAASVVEAPVRQRRAPGIIHQDAASAPVGYVANTPSTLGQAWFDLPASLRRLATGPWPDAPAPAVQAPPSAVVFDALLGQRRQPGGAITLAPVVTTDAQTPTTAGLQDLVPILLRSPWSPANQRFVDFAPAGFIVVGTTTPTTSGIQEFDIWSRRRPMPAGQHQDAALAPVGYVANTPQTSGLSGFDPIWRRLSAVAADINLAPLFSVLTTNPAVDGFDAARWMSGDRQSQNWVTMLTAEVVIAATPSPLWDLPQRLRRQTPTASGYAQFIEPVLTPSAFSFARFDIPRWTYWLRAPAHPFSVLVGREIISPPAIIAKPPLRGIDMQALLDAIDAQAAIQGTDDAADLDGLVEG